MDTAALLPVLLLGPVIGVLTGRMPRRTRLIGTQPAYLVIGTVLAIVAATGHVGLPVPDDAALVTGVVNAIDGPAHQVYLIDLVGPRLIGASIGVYEVVINAPRVLCPAAGRV